MKARTACILRVHPRRMRAHVKAGTTCTLRVHSEADVSACDGWNIAPVTTYHSEADAIASVYAIVT